MASHRGSVQQSASISFRAGAAGLGAHASATQRLVGQSATISSYHSPLWNPASSSPNRSGHCGSFCKVQVLKVLKSNIEPHGHQWAHISLLEVLYSPSVSSQVTRPEHVKSQIRAPPQAEVGLEEIVGPENPYPPSEHRESFSPPPFKQLERQGNSSLPSLRRLEHQGNSSSPPFKRLEQRGSSSTPFGPLERGRTSSSSPFARFDHRKFDTGVRKSGFSPSFKWFKCRAVGV